MALSALPVWLISTHMWDWGAGGWIFGILMMAFWVALIVVVVYLLMRAFGYGTHAAPPGPPGTYYGRLPGTPPEPPLEIARRRYAAGEITKEQLDEIEKNLKGS